MPKFSLASYWVLSFAFSSLWAQDLAFPTAQGFGRYTAGGRGGEVYRVTNLEDSGPGSLRDAVSQPDRIVVFEAGGIIRIDSRIAIKRNITIAGQTAPGGGITIYGNGIALNGDSGNNIIRYIRIRMGVGGDSGKDAVGISEGQNYILDHVSVSWGRDGTIDINGSGIDNITIQNCIIAQGLHSHSTGGLMQSGKASVLRTLYIDNHTRNPKGRGVQEYINNVIYNWRVSGYILGDTEGLSEANVMGNYFISGPSTESNPFNSATPSFHIYARDNFWDNNRNGNLDGALIDNGTYGPVTFEQNPYDYPGVEKLYSAREAVDNVIENAGASIVRDAVDEFLINQLKSYGTQGAIISNESENGIPGVVGTLESGEAPLDTDKDGMPDNWEKEHGLNPEDPSDAMGLQLSQEHYVNVEMYVNELAGDPVLFKEQPDTTTTSLTSPNKIPKPDSKFLWLGKFLVDVMGRIRSGFVQ